MRIDITVDDKTETIGFPIKGKHTKQAFKKISDLEKKEKDGELGDALIEYVEWRDELIADITGKSVEWLDDLESEEKAKLTDAFNKAVENESGFIRR